jgi:hypothetical protein
LPLASSSSYLSLLVILTWLIKLVEGTNRRLVDAGIHPVGEELEDSLGVSVAVPTNSSGSKVLHSRNGRERDSRWGRVQHGVNPAEVDGILPVPLVQLIDHRADPVSLFVVLEQ